MKEQKEKLTVVTYWDHYTKFVALMPFDEIAEKQDVFEITNIELFRGLEQIEDEAFELINDALGLCEVFNALTLSKERDVISMRNIVAMINEKSEKAHSLLDILIRDNYKVVEASQDAAQTKGSIEGGIIS